MPILQLLFSLNGYIESFYDFIINQFLCFVFISKTFIKVKPVFCHPSHQVIGDTNIQSCIVVVG